MSFVRRLSDRFVHALTTSRSVSLLEQSTLTVAATIVHYGRVQVKFGRTYVRLGHQWTIPWTEVVCVKRKNARTIQLQFRVPLCRPSLFRLLEPTSASAGNARSGASCKLVLHLTPQAVWQVITHLLAMGRVRRQWYGLPWHIPFGWKVRFVPVLVH